MSRRAERRKQLAKRKIRWIAITQWWWGLTANEMAGIPDPLEEEPNPFSWDASIYRHWSWDNTAGHAIQCAFRRARTPALCSCECCGNPRRLWGAPTNQERRSLDDYRFQVGELEGMGVKIPRAKGLQKPRMRGC
jgi:hypothetical protein